MKDHPRRLTSIFIFALFISLSGCGPKKNQGPPPAWLSADAPAYDRDHFYGKGCAQYQISNRYFKRSTAYERARVDLAVNMHEYLMAELSGDTTEARRVIEAALPGREVDETYMDEEGNFCARARVPRNTVEELSKNR